MPFLRALRARKINNFYRRHPKFWNCLFQTNLVPRTFHLAWGREPRSQDLLPGLRAGREKALASAGHVRTLHPEILGVIN